MNTFGYQKYFRETGEEAAELLYICMCLDDMVRGVGGERPGAATLGILIGLQLALRSCGGKPETGCSGF
jgi:hypothetical protein